MDNFKIIPDAVFDSDITPSAKLLFSLIFGLSRLNNYCYASNDFLIEKMKASKRSIIGWINELDKIGFINIEYKKSHKGTERKIYINLHVQNNVTRGADLRKEGCKIPYEGVQEFAPIIDNINKEVIIDNTNKDFVDFEKSTLSNNKNIEELDYYFEFIEIMDFLSKSNGLNYTIPKTHDGLKKYKSYTLVKSILNLKYSKEDVKSVIADKTKEWLNDIRMCKYLRPKTLFLKSNFEDYVAGLKIIANFQTKQNSEDIESYFKNWYEKDLVHEKRTGNFEKLKTKLSENFTKLSDLSDKYQNPQITALFLFDLLYLKMSNLLSGSTPERKYEDFEKIYSTWNDYQKNKGDIRKLLHEHYSKTKF